MAADRVPAGRGRMERVQGGRRGPGGGRGGASRCRGVSARPRGKRRRGPPGGGGPGEGRGPGAGGSGANGGDAGGAGGSGGGKGRIIRLPVDVGAPAVNAAASPTVARLGAHFTLYITATFGAGVEVNLREPMDLGPAFEIRRR